MAIFLRQQCPYTFGPPAASRTQSTPVRLRVSSRRRRRAALNVKPRVRFKKQGLKHRMSVCPLVEKLLYVVEAGLLKRVQVRVVGVISKEDLGRKNRYFALKETRHAQRVALGSQHELEATRLDFRDGNLGERDSQTNNDAHCFHSHS
jgi:hypothetical protein